MNQWTISVKEKRMEMGMGVSREAGLGSIQSLWRREGRGERDCGQSNMREKVRFTSPSVDSLPALCPPWPGPSRRSWRAPPSGRAPRTQTAACGAPSPSQPEWSDCCILEDFMSCESQLPWDRSRWQSTCCSRPAWWWCRGRSPAPAAWSWACAAQTHPAPRSWIGK